MSTKSKEEMDAESQKLLLEMRAKQIKSALGKTITSLIDKHPTSPFIRGGILQKLNLLLPDDEKDVIGWVVSNYKW
jgi:hypothetical protein